jgi:hypothetical protein
MSGKVFPDDGAFLLVRRNRSTVQADLETEIRLGSRIRKECLLSNLAISNAAS